MKRRLELEYLEGIRTAVHNPRLDNAINEPLRPPLSSNLTEDEVAGLEQFDYARLKIVLLLNTAIERLTVGW